MLKIKTVPILARIISKIDLKPIITKFKELDIVKDGQKSFGELDNEQKSIIGIELVTELIPQLDRVAEELPALIASFKDISVEEANELDFMEVIKEIISDEGIKTFFTHALQKKVAPEL